MAKVAGVIAALVLATAVGTALAIGTYSALRGPPENPVGACTLAVGAAR